MTPQPSLFDQLQPEPANDDDALTLANFAERAYLDYAISVVKGRALPDVCDGQKPVQRRILYAMNELGLTTSSKPRKSAAVVGDVLGKLHPHGDQSVYDALVRMAQDFSMRYPLIDGQGNFGSRDGDGAAAMRYTEARLTPIAELLLEEIDLGTVDFVPNYDGSSEEPRMLPSRLPLTLLNGSSGIAVGMATEIPPHNLAEIARAVIALIRNPKISHAELMEIVPGPDFPGGGQIITASGQIAEMYENGRGSLKVRARWEVEEMARGQWQIVVNELPHGTSSQKIMEEIEEMTNPKVRPGKKSLSAEQNALRQTMLGVLDSIRDESSRDAPVRLVFEPRSKRQDPEEFMQLLLSHTSLESNTSLNLVMIGLDGSPRQKGLRDILQEWTTFRFDTVRRRTEWRLGRVDDRIHILEGREMVLLNIDKVIRIIRDSDEPKPALIKAFKLSERQADDILEIRLRQLARMEKLRIEQELTALREEKDTLHDLLNNPASMRRRVIREIETDQKKFGDARRTLIEEAKRAFVEQKIIDEPVTVIISEKGWVRSRSGHGHNLSQLNFKAGDALYGTFECRSTDQLLVFGSTGRIYSVAVHQLPNARGDGMPITTFIEVAPNDPIMHYFAGPADMSLLIATSTGYGFGAKVADMTSRVRQGKLFIALEKNEQLLQPRPIREKDKWIAGLSRQGRFLMFPIEELRHLSSGGHGVILMALDPKETLLAALPTDEKGCVVVCLAKNQTRHEIRISGNGINTYSGKRARKGRVIESRFKPVNLEPVPSASHTNMPDEK
ncbi:DNA topoisomerase IV subunit A [Oxalobacter vibrioformis]|uniref:DNA topoisomerase 4 subunit A n=1 Tax=Oxalobacter vibrioformis TaxID=933080 RepID=A0A9E9P3R8_9BURK|nr:DNA topoisomerase IV subunit A [Oxalobacter vibrioformis]WAW11277.1 DNA topoisomerase IV subunit A [Oxalobacter vibrioformis]